MRNITEPLNDLVEKKARIEQLKAEHPEMVEAVQLIEEYTTLFEEVCQRCQQQTTTWVPYPVYTNYNPLIPQYRPVCDTQQVTITFDAGTTKNCLIDTTCKGMLI